MKILFHLGHPAHFHLFKNVIQTLTQKDHQIFILIKKKDVLEELLKASGLVYQNILSKGRKNNPVSIAIGLLSQDFKLFSFCLKTMPDILVGTSIAISHVGKVLRIPAINVNEDDSDVVPLYSKLAYPWATNILAPRVCRMGNWSDKAVFYESYHELAYLHPNTFQPNKGTASKYISLSKPYFILRFAMLGAHHDVGIKGISNEIALKIIQLLSPFGNIYITSERALDKELDRYRINLRPIDIHHVMHFASLYIGDSQTMAAESAVLGVPFIRFNDFVDRISYIDELEKIYKLGFGIKTNQVDILYSKINEMIKMPNRVKVFQERRQKMLSEKIDLTSFMVWFIENYPNSLQIIKRNPDYHKRFK
jgi:hypothetical protein